MSPGEIVAGRFALEALAGTGGMGAVWRARDRLSGAEVAVKVIVGEGAQRAARFAQEARVLATLTHPAIVRYVAHGVGADGSLWLAMDWLAGEDLSARLARAGLTVAESLALVTRVAGALAAAHAQGIVHRDIKPGNLFLPSGDLAQVTVLDFGVARVAGGAGAATRTGLLLGTPGYIAPEQARGEREVGPSADIFSLGCVLFECLTGRPTFVGEHAMALLARILLEEAPRPRSLRPDLPAELDALVARMLAKDPASRPADGAALVAELAELGSLGQGEARFLGPRPSLRPALTATEQQLLSVVLVRGVAQRPVDSAAETLIVSGDEATIALDPPSLPSSTMATIEQARALLRPLGGRVEPLAGGALVVTVTGRGAATDQAARAARCALALRALAPDAQLSLSTGRGDASAPWPVGEALDRAARLLERGARGIAVDEVTAGLLDARFSLSGDDGGLVLVGEQESDGPARTLLGRPVPCVGRERELGLLRGLLDECENDSVARAMLVTAPAGVGKSRLRHELLRSFEARAEPVEIFFGQGDPVSAGAPFGMIGPALRRAAGVVEGEPLAVRRQKLRARVARHVAEADRARVAEFLGELAAVPFPDEESVQLRAARVDPMLMGDQMRRAFEDFLAKETRAQPVIFVLEDLHWGDLPSVRFIDAALRNLADHPLFVLALARPEVHALFPDLWVDRGGAELRLGELSRKASERLVRQVLGEAAVPALVERLSAQAAGNAFYLEELLRAVAEGKGDAPPQTVMAMVQSRLEALSPEARRLLRAGSIFGQGFSEAGVRALLGDDLDAQRHLRDQLASLVEREIIVRRPRAAAADDEYAFRHALVREAAYAMLTPADRELGHRLSGAFLEQAGESEAIVLAEHFEQGREPARAVRWFLRATEQALEGNDVDAAIARAERGVHCGAEGEELGELRLRQAEAHLWQGDNAPMEARAIEAMSLLPEGSARWCGALAEAASAGFRLGHPERTEALSQRLLAQIDAGHRSNRLFLAASRLSFNLFLAGRNEPARALLDRAEAVAAELGVVEPSIRGGLLRARAREALSAGSAEQAVRLYEAAAVEFERAGDLRVASQTRVSAAYGRIELGSYEEAERALRASMAAADRLGLRYVSGLCRNNLGNVLCRVGALDEALVHEREAVRSFTAQGDQRIGGNSRIYLAGILARSGDLDAALREALAAVELLAVFPKMQAFGLANLARIRLRAGDIEGALSSAGEAMRILEAKGSVEESETLVRLAWAEALEASGDRGAAAQAITAARAQLLEKAARIEDAACRERFLGRVEENARALLLADEWLTSGEGAATT